MLPIRAADAVIAADAEIVGDVFVFQQDNSSILWVESLRYETYIH